MTGALRVLLFQLLPPSTPLLAPVKFRMEIFWYRLTQVHLEMAVKAERTFDLFLLHWLSVTVQVIDRKNSSDNVC